jgi:phosphatidylserine/phosphatidylglycerophosphate/cardiolipin synthase-like enzyme
LLNAQAMTRLGRHLLLAVLASTLAGAGACAGADDGPEAPPMPPDNPLPPLPAGTVAVVELYPLDIWAQLLPAATADLDVARAGAAITTTGGTPADPIRYLALTAADAGAYAITLAAPDHDPVTVTLNFDGTGELDGAKLGALPAGGAVSASHEMRMQDDGATAVPVHSIYLGLRHQWFSAEGRPARRGNRVRFLMDGEEGWGAVSEELTAASDHIMMASWWFESDFELTRTEGNLTAAQRSARTIMGKLEASPATKRVLIGQFWGQDGILAGLNVDDALTGHGARSGDNFEYMGQANITEGMFRFEIPGFELGERVRAMRPETADRSFDAEAMVESRVTPRMVDLTDWPITLDVQHASWHQKFAVIDDVAFVGGMNTKSTDWDTSQHRVFDARRMEYGASDAARQDVRDKEALPDLGPRKDYMVRIDGPAVQDVADVFHKRWELARLEDVEFSGNATPFTVDREQTAHADGLQLQVTTTMPDPLWEHGIVETWLNAVAKAEKYILVEDQYWRAPILTEAILRRMAQVPTLQLVVITKPINEWTDPGCAWSYRTNTQLEAAVPGRYHLLQLRAFDTVVTWGFDETESRFEDIDTHSKLLIVDDVFLSVGSANKNNRGLIYEGEMSVAIKDAAFVREARRRVLQNLLGAGVVVSDDATQWKNQLLNAAAWNDGVWNAWDNEGGDISLDGAPLPAAYAPRGFVYSLEFRDVNECFLEDVGPDMT